MFTRRPALKEINVSRILSVLDEEQKKKSNPVEIKQEIKKVEPIVDVKENKKTIVKKKQDIKGTKVLPTPGKDIEWL